MMQRRSLYTLLIATTLGLGLVSCRSGKDAAITPVRPIPSAYSDSSGGTSAASIQWRSFFSDSVLVTLIDSALNSNPDLKMALQRVEAARASARLAGAALLPSANAVVMPSIRKFGLYTMDGAGNIVTEMTPGRMIPIHLPDYYLGVQASWEADIWGKLGNQRASAAAQFLAGNEGVSFVRSMLVAEISASYFELQAIDTELEIIRQTVERQKEALEVVELQKAAGRTTELAVQQFRSQLLGTQSLELELKQAAVLHENRINFLIGRFPQPVSRSVMKLDDDWPVVESGVPSDLLANRPDIRKAEQLLRASKFDVRAAKAAFYPSLNITAGIGYQAFSTEFLFLTPASIAYHVIGNLTAPLINRAAIKARFRTAKANQTEALYNYHKSILNGYTEVVNGVTSLYTLKKVATLRGEQSETMKQSVETARELYRTARASYLEVLVAEQNSLNSQLELVDVRKRQRQAGINLYRALGGGWR